MKGIIFKKIKIPNSYLFELTVDSNLIKEIAMMAIGDVKFVITPIGNQFDVDVKHDEAANQVYGRVQQIPDDDIDDSETEPPII